MENEKKGAFACVDSNRQYLQEGLTKREYFAGLAMQGILSKGSEYDNEWICVRSLKLADELIKQLGDELV
jgi:hypothetical protein